jgi:rfaE bifunctional protein nucleotidyltransferase chain/domain
MEFITKIQEPEQAAKTVHSWQDIGFEVVFTNGCFDLLHTGHIYYLYASRQLGNKLIVAINDDDSVRRLKGPSRPVNTREDRALLLAALEFVDLVTWFAEDTPLELIQRILPDILTKGGDYSVENIVGAEIVIDHGGAVLSLPFVEGYSTTNILNK